jgi:replicative DNA helicase
VSDLDIERTVLGAILLDSRLYEQVVDLRPEDFSLDWHRCIYLRMVDLAESSRPIDLTTLVEELERHKQLHLAGGLGYVSGLIDGVPERTSIQHYVKMMRTDADRRRAAKLAESAQRLAEDPSVLHGRAGGNRQRFNETCLRHGASATTVLRGSTSIALLAKI